MYIKFNYNMATYNRQLKVSNIDNYLTQINKLLDSEGNISINRKRISMINIFLKCFNTSTSLIVWYLILDRFF